MTIVAITKRARLALVLMLATALPFLSSCSTDQYRRPSVEGQAAVSLFDGKSLDGWRAFWSVKDGAIMGELKPPIKANTFLIHSSSFSDFELRFKYRFLSVKGNSGMQFRSRPYVQGGEYSVTGYQANVVTPDANERFGFLYDEHGRGVLAYLGERAEIVGSNSEAIERKVMGKLEGTPDFARMVINYPAWNEGIIIAYKDKLMYAINGYLMSEVTDNDTKGRKRTGFIALELRAGPPMGATSPRFE